LESASIASRLSSPPVPSMAELERAVALSANRLAELQEPDGGFPLAAVASETLGSPGDSLFSTATVISLAAPVLSAECLSRGTAYILSRQNQQGLWTWDAEALLPPDSDDTACCLGALVRAGVNVDTRAGIRALRKFWRWRGPFRTWLAKGAWNARRRDDAVVNCNVLWALRELGAAPSRAEQRAVERIVAKQRDATPYYCSKGALAWAAARAAIPTPYLDRPSEAELAGRPLECALWMLATPVPSTTAIAQLLDLVGKQSEWKAEPWVRGNPGRWESRAVTLAFVLAALRHSIDRSSFGSEALTDRTQCPTVCEDESDPATNRPRQQIDDG